MNVYRPVTTHSDRRTALPETPDGRRQHIDRALASLDQESRRVERLGLEDPQVRCAEERRYWAFLAAVHAVTNPQSSLLAHKLSCWLSETPDTRAR